MTKESQYTTKEREIIEKAKKIPGSIPCPGPIYSRFEMKCDLCHQTKAHGVLIQDISMCDTCACKLVDIGELDVRDFMDARRI